MSISRNRLVGHCTTHLFLFLMWLCLLLFPISFNGILGMVAEAELLGPVEPKLRSRTFGSAGGVSELCFCCCGETLWLKVTLLLLFYSSPKQYTLTWVSSPSTPSSSSLSSSFPQTKLPPSTFRKEQTSQRYHTKLKEKIVVCFNKTRYRHPYMGWVRKLSRIEKGSKSRRKSQRQPHSQCYKSHNNTKLTAITYLQRA